MQPARARAADRRRPAMAAGFFLLAVLHPLPAASPTQADPSTLDVAELRAPGSTVDLANPAARVGDAYFRGSGTSMSTAWVAGAAAAVAAAHPDWGPDEVKAALARSTHTPGGALDLDAALGLAAVTPANGDLFPLRTPGAAAEPDAPGWLGELDWRAGAFEGLRWTLADGAEPAAGPAAWEAGPWLATRWTAGQAAGWAAQQWLSRSWAARSWAGGDWIARSWGARSWGARSWGLAVS